MSKIIVAIDGPAGAGKSTSAKLVAQRLNFLYIDSGAMYRAVTYLALKNKIEKADEIIDFVKGIYLELNFENGETQVKANGEDITENLRSDQVNKKVSEISKLEKLREILVKKQRSYAKVSPSARGIVMEGRDIGTIVFPEADVKIFLTASIEQRAKRRAKEYSENIPIDEIKQNLESRDILDSTRKVSPLQKAPDAVVVDTSKVTIDEQVEIILKEIEKAAKKKGLELLKA
jgi:cytidylate kinase